MEAAIYLSVNVKFSHSREPLCEEASFSFLTKVCFNVSFQVPHRSDGWYAVLLATSAIGKLVTFHWLIIPDPRVPADYKTDAVIQSSLRNQLSGDVTVITVAHRLQTSRSFPSKIRRDAYHFHPVMDADKIVRLDFPMAFLS